LNRQEEKPEVHIELTENKDTPDAFADAPTKIAEESKSQPKLVLCCWLPEDYDKKV
jgi:hypothetical protein